LTGRWGCFAYVSCIESQARLVQLLHTVLQGSQSIAITASVRESAQELATIATTVNRVEEGVTRTIPASVQENTQQLATVVATVNCVEESVTRAITASVQGNRQEFATLVAAVNHVEEGVTRAITASVQGNRQELATLVATVNRVEEGVKRTIMVSTTDLFSNLPKLIGLGSLLTPPAIWGGNIQLYSLRSNSILSISNLTFYFILDVECLLLS
jgi:hypothetical protein